MTTKLKIAQKISREINITQQESKFFLDCFLGKISDQSKTMKIKISGFGTFSTKRTLERVGRNPKSKESYIIPSFKKLTFNASAKVKGDLNW